MLDRGAQQSVPARHEHNLLRHRAVEPKRAHRPDLHFPLLFQPPFLAHVTASKSYSSRVYTLSYRTRCLTLSPSPEMAQSAPSPATQLVQSLLALADPAYILTPPPQNATSDSTSPPVASSSAIPPAKTAINKLLSHTNHLIPARSRDSKSDSIDDPAARDRILMSWKMSDFAYQREPCPFPTRARGLFTERIVTPGSTAKDNEEYRIVARGYDKFFSIDEVSWTKVRSSWYTVWHD